MSKDIKHILSNIFCLSFFSLTYGQGSADTLYFHESSAAFETGVSIDESHLFSGNVDKNKDKQGEWMFYFLNGNPRISCQYLNDTLVGKCIHYYSNGKIKSELKYKDGVPAGLWKSYYLNSELQGEILWNNSGMPVEIRLYFERERVALVKTLDYSQDEVQINVKSYFENGAKFEAYSIFQKTDEIKKLIDEYGLESLVHFTPHLGIDQIPEGKLSGYYQRWYNNGKEWMNLYFEDGKLLEVISQNMPNGNPVSETYENGFGKVVHFHHYGDTAAVVNYSKGYKNGIVRFFHKRNNTYRTGFFSENNRSGNWTTKSYSGKIKSEHLFKDFDGSLDLLIYGPKSHISEKFSIRKGTLEGKAISYDFYGDTAATYSYRNGLLNGTFIRFLNGNTTRYGEYLNGEQTGSWNTKGLFNEVSYTTEFGHKPVICYSEHLPKFNFELKSNIDVPITLKETQSEAYSMSEHISLQSKNMFLQSLLQTPDSDLITGTSVFKLKINTLGQMTDLILIKSPSENASLYAADLINEYTLYYPKFTHGFPDASTWYVQIDHLR